MQLKLQARHGAEVFEKGFHAFRVIADARFGIVLTICARPMLERQSASAANTTKVELPWSVTVPCGGRSWGRGTVVLRRSWGRGR